MERVDLVVIQGLIYFEWVIFLGFEAIFGIGYKSLGKGIIKGGGIYLIMFLFI